VGSGVFLFGYGGETLTAELDLLIALLKTTGSDRVPIEDVKGEFRIASDAAMKLLRKLKFEGLIHLDDNFVQVNAAMRMQLTIKALALGADIESTTKLLRWQEFEEIAGIALEDNDYVVQRNVRLKHGENRMEIDVVGCRKPIVLCVDCKHWQRSLSPSSLERIAEAQAKRTRVLADYLPNVASTLVCQKWRTARFVPVVLSLLHCSNRFHNNVPIVSILQFQDFVSQLPVNITAIEHTERIFGHLGHAFQD